PPYRIHAGQRIRLTAPPGNKPKNLAGKQKKLKESKRSADKGVRRVETSSSKLPKRSTGKVSWRWPTAGKVAKTFSVSKGRKGVDIKGRPGQSIRAAAGGGVVYSGDGLIGYGKLVIIKHNDTYLSAYAHNRKLLVKEGDTVKPGQKIAEMGQTGKSGSILHFEIRRDGKPEDPLRHLPKVKAGVGR
ncbi:MAG: peptidoglycan DD-metalloendopeptidase family protein, partial [Gammaproteobacteria bacterium]|nr:peptidoglycan DD-metalloendopeptidase family protein [Gammaproteobacteria bacterium]